MNPSYKRPSNRILNESPRHAVIQNMQSAKPTEVMQTEAGTIVFQNGMAVLPNDSRPDDVRAELSEKHGLHPGHFVLHKGQRNKNRDGIHNYVFGCWPEMPWKRIDDG